MCARLVNCAITSVIIYNCYDDYPFIRIYCNKSMEQIILDICIKGIVWIIYKFIIRFRTVLENIIIAFINIEPSIGNSSQYSERNLNGE